MNKWVIFILVGITATLLGVVTALIIDYVFN